MACVVRGGRGGCCRRMCRLVRLVHRWGRAPLPPLTDCTTYVPCEDSGTCLGVEPGLKLQFQVVWLSRSDVRSRRQVRMVSALVPGLLM